MASPYKADPVLDAWQAKHATDTVLEMERRHREYIAALKEHERFNGKPPRCIMCHKEMTERMKGLVMSDKRFLCGTDRKPYFSQFGTFK